MTERDDQPDDTLIDALCDPVRHSGRIDDVARVETHISWVLLAGEFAYKIKKPVRLPFVDFTSLEARRRFCEDELRLNRRLAPDLYLEVVPVGGTTEDPQLGAKPAIEYAVKMRRFPDQARLDRRLARGALQPAQIDELAELIARFHGELEPVTAASADEAERVASAALENFDALQTLAASDRERQTLARLREWTEIESRALAPLLRARRAGGSVRECHGDLHLENLVEIDGRILPFDALEFDLDLRTVDVINETAFLAMDLLAHGHADTAFGFLNRYLELSGDYEGVALLRYFLVYRALVRAKVRALSGGGERGLDTGDEGPGPYFRLASALLDPGAPILVITHGYSGSGKTTATAPLITHLPALRLRSDLERKRLHGLAPTQRGDAGIGAGLYDAAATDKTYQRLADLAAIALTGGFNVVVDAAFLEGRRRAAFQALAARHDAGFAIVSATAPQSVLRERVRRRAQTGDDASDAGTDVLSHQLQTADALTDAESSVTLEIDTTAEHDVERLAAALREIGVHRAPPGSD